MTREDAARWHAALAASAGQLAGSLARRAHSKRLVEDLLSMLRPVIREMETDALQYKALENIEKGERDGLCSCGVECQDSGNGRCRYDPKPSRVKRPAKTERVRRK